MKTSEKEDNKIHRLYRLDELKNYEVADKDTDVRGFIVLGGDTERLGKVKELIVDPETGKVRYLEVKLDNDLVLIDDYRDIIIPIGVAKLDGDHDNIIVNNLNRSNLKFYPPYKGEPITRQYEQKLRDSHRFTMLNNNLTGTKSRGEEISSQEDLEYRDEFSEPANVKDADKDIIGRYKAEIEVLRKERDIARAERDILKVQLDQAKRGVKDDFYDHEDFDADKFYESRRKRNME